MRELTGHGSLINQLCPVEIGGRVLLASASEDRTVGLWDARDGALLTCIPVHHPVRSCAAHGSTLVIGSTAGPLAIDLFDEVLR